MKSVGGFLSAQCSVTSSPFESLLVDVFFIFNFQAFFGESVNEIYYTPEN